MTGDQHSWIGAGVLQPGFGNGFSTEALPGALPVGQNSPQEAPYGLYAELISGTAFTAPRAENRRTWTYRLRPSASHGRFEPYGGAPLFQTGDVGEAPPDRLRWSPLPWAEAPADFLESLVTFAVTGRPNGAAGAGAAVHLYRATRSMQHRVLSSADGELLILPQAGRIRLYTELGLMELAPWELGVVPRGLRFRVELPDGPARGYVCENFGRALRLPELGPIGSNGLANARDFLSSSAGYEDVDGAVEHVQKFQGRLWRTELDHSPLDVVAWHGNHAPYKYDLARFMAIGTISFDHPDPSINTVLTSPTETPGVANLDLVAFAPRWLVAERTFRPPWFHRNVMSEFMGLIEGVYDAKADGFLPGGASLHNSMTAHGPDAATYRQAVEAELSPHKLDASLAFMFETAGVLHPTRFGMETAALQGDYDACWQGFAKARLPDAPR